METNVICLPTIFLLRGIWRHGNAAAYVYFCVFLRLLADRFRAAGRDEDWSYAVALLVFSALHTAYLLVKVTLWWGSLYHMARGEVSEAKRRAQPDLCAVLLGLFLLLAVIATNIVLIVRLWQWFIEFRAAGEMSVAIPCAVLGVLSALNTALGVVAIGTLFLAGFAMTLSSIFG